MSSRMSGSLGSTATVCAATAAPVIATKPPTAQSSTIQ